MGVHRIDCRFNPWYQMPRCESYLLDLREIILWILIQGQHPNFPEWDFFMRPHFRHVEDVQSKCLGVFWIKDLNVHCPGWVLSALDGVEEIFSVPVRVCGGHLGGFGHEDQEYVKEVVEGCRNLLRTVVEGLLKEGYLKHAPVRTYFRIISGAMFLLKTFALGAPKSDVEVSIGLLDRTVDALRNCVVDDIHLGTRFGDLLES